MNAARTVAYLLISFLLCTGCTHKKKLYTSECGDAIHYKKVSFIHLIDSIKFYDKQFVEVSGTYHEGKHLSALVNDSLFTDHGDSHSLWVNFTQDCPLVMPGTGKGLFEPEDGSYLQMNNRIMTIRGRVDAKSKGHQKLYCATISDVSMVELE
jgi:hypothetical protein